MTKLKNGAWVLIADGEKALFLRNDLDAQDLDLNVVRIEEQENPSDREQSANRPGRMHDGGPGQKSAVDDTDWHELAKERFASDLSDKLYEMAHKGEFERLVIVASPQVLGVLRDDMHKEVTDKIREEGNLTEGIEEDLRRAVEDWKRSFA